MRISLAATLALTAIATPACTDSYGGPSSVSLGGSWSGMVGEPQSGSALRMSWTATQTGTSVSGPASLVKPAMNVSAAGMLTGSVSGNEVSLSYSAPAGTVPAFSTCAISGTGSAIVNGNALSGTLRLTFTSCAGTGLEPTGSDRLALTRQ